MQGSHTSYRKDMAVLLLLAATGFAQVILMQYSLTFDIVDQYFPWRRFAAECYHNGIIPFWNPYQHFGYAFTADPQSGAWYPFVWLSSLFGGYNVYVSQLEFFIHIFIAGAGMYLLTLFFTSCRKSALVTGTVYMLSGFFIGNAQHLTYIISGAWFPWVIYFYLMMTTTFRWSHVPAFALCFFMMISGGYPAFTIITFYVLVFLFLYKLFLVFRKRKERLMNFMSVNFIALMVLFLLCSFVLVSLWQNVNLVARSTALPLKLVQFNPFSPQSLISFFWPLVTTTDYSFFHTDMSMANLHFGLVMFTALLFSFSLKKNRLHALLLLAGVLFLMASFGEYTPVRKWLYDFVPMMDLFRFPSIFRLFALVCFLLLASFYLKKVFADEETARKFIRRVFLLTISVSVFGLIFSILKGGTLRSAPGFYDFIQQQGFYDAMMFQSLVMMLLSCLLAFFILLRKKPFALLIAFVFVEMIFAAQINAPKTVYSEFKTGYINETLKELPVGFPAPENLPVVSYSDSSGFKTPFWRNLSLLRKQPGFDGYNSFRMLYYDSLADFHPLMKEVIKNRIAYPAASVSFYNGSISSTGEIQSHPSHLYFHDSLKNKIPPFLYDSTASIRFTHFAPDKIVIETQSAFPQLVTLMQHYHPWRKVAVDNQSSPYFISNYLMTTVPVSEGRHEVSFEISNPRGVLAFIISSSALLMVVIALGLLKAKRL